MAERILLKKGKPAREVPPVSFVDDEITRRAMEGIDALFPPEAEAAIAEVCAAQIVKVPAHSQGPKLPTMSFAELEAALSIVHRIASHKRTPFMSRIRNLQRLGICQAALRGRGVEARFGLSDALQMAFALELIQAGISPEKIALHMPQIWPKLWANVTTDTPKRWAIFDFRFLASLTDDPNELKSFVLTDDIHDAFVYDGYLRAIILDVVEIAASAIREFSRIAGVSDWRGEVA